MALVSADLKQAILDAFNGFTGTPQDAITLWGSTVSTYLKDNTEIAYSWVAVSPPPANTPDPITTAQGGFDSLNLTVTLSNSNDRTVAVTQFQTELIADMTIASITITDSGFVVSGTMGGGAGLNSLDILNSVSGGNVDDAMTQVADELIRWVKSLTGAVVSGSHGIYTGTGTITTIT